MSEDRVLRRYGASGNPGDPRGQASGQEAPTWKKRIPLTKGKWIDLSREDPKLEKCEIVDQKVIA